MLRTRVITAVILAAIFLAAVWWLPRSGWALFTFAVAAIALWEWSRMAQFAGNVARIFLAVSFVLALAFLYAFQADEPSAMWQWGQTAISTGLGASVVFWVVIAPLWLKFHWRPRNAFVLAAAGWVVIFPTWFALMVHRPREADPISLLLLMALVWVADICAYFAGRAFGKHKLAPNVSPGKTWEGVAGAMLGVVVYASLCLAAARRFGGAEGTALKAGAPVVVVSFVILTMLSIVGDLFESWMKRGAGLKDSSNLLPGHGGLFDRIDALTSTLPTAPFVILAVQRLIS